MADANPCASTHNRDGQTVRCKPVERNQLLLRTVDVEKLVGPSHAVRAIWALVGTLDLQPYWAQIGAVKGEAGRPAWDPHMLISLWIYALKDGIGSAREIERRCGYHPAYQWLTGMEVVNYHTLADFYTAHEAALQSLFIEVLGVLSHQGLITLRRVMHDGTKIKAAASDKSFHRQATLEQHLKQAEEQVQAMADPHAERLTPRRAKAKQRALREKQERLKQALKELEQLKNTRAQSQADKDKTNKKKQLRVSSTDPDARVMLGAKGAYGPAYNVQISTDAQAKIIVGVGVTQCSSDAGELPAAVERIEQNLQQKPEQMVADAAYPTSDTIHAMAEQGIDLIGPLPQRKKASSDILKRNGVSPDFYPPAFNYDPSTDRYQCPPGKLLRFETEEREGGWIKRRYRARPSDCRSCPFQAQCCPKTKKGRSIVRTMEKTAQWQAFEAKMQTDQAKQIYKQRAGVAEFPNAWIKQKMGLRQFRLRGRLKVRMQMLWACLAYNICQWIRLCWRPQLPTQA